MISIQTHRVALSQKLQKQILKPLTAGNTLCKKCLPSQTLDSGCIGEILQLTFKKAGKMLRIRPRDIFFLQIKKGKEAVLRTSVPNITCVIHEVYNPAFEKKSQLCVQKWMKAETLWLSWIKSSAHWSFCILLSNYCTIIYRNSFFSNKPKHRTKKIRKLIWHNILYHGIFRRQKGFKGYRFCLR